MIQLLYYTALLYLFLTMYVTCDPKNTSTVFYCSTIQANILFSSSTGHSISFPLCTVQTAIRT